MKDDLIQPLYLNIFYGIAALIAAILLFLVYRGIRSFFH